MSSNQARAQAPGGDVPGFALEGHLRKLILTNAATDCTDLKPSQNASHSAQEPSSDHISNETSSSPTRAGPALRPTEFVTMHHEIPMNVTAHGGPQPLKSNKRRPNQAQRRQMAPQFTLTPESPLQTPNQSTLSQNNSVYQRHIPTQSQPQAWPASTRPDLPHLHRSWSESSHNYSSNLPTPPLTSLGSYSAHSSTQHARKTTKSLSYYRRPHFKAEEIAVQANFLNILCYQIVAGSEIDRSEIAEKELFRQRVEAICRDVIAQYEQLHDPSTDFSPWSVELKCFGSLSSGFATKTSDMDLGLLSPFSRIEPGAPESPVPRLLEKALLEAGLGARLLTRTRVPIIKLCELPSEGLFQQLIAEREKWENGIQNKRPVDIEDQQENDITSQDDNIAQTKPDAPRDEATEFATQLPCKAANKKELMLLKQGTKHSLAAYYSMTKRILRRAGGRDVTISNYKDFTEKDWDILNQVCVAFVEGLFDLALRNCLLQLQGLSSESGKGNKHPRSLLEIFLLSEGEHIKLAWLSWSATSSLPTEQGRLEELIKSWDNLQSNSRAGSDLFGHTKELQLLLDKIKKLPQIQILFLEQASQETASEYYERAHAIITNLETRGWQLSQSVHSVVLSRYASGISNENIREEFQRYFSEFPEHCFWQAIGCRHKSLDLACELEKVMRMGLYHATQLTNIKHYVELLRSPLQQTRDRSKNPLFYIPVTPQLVAVVHQMKVLPDPHQMNPNQAPGKYREALEFPKTGVGVQCDINFSSHLAMQNTLLLRCYSHTDSRVRPMVIFVKHWAKARGINSGYRGTLSSYGYVLMVLHYLVNIVQPFVCPNLQQLSPQRHRSVLSSHSKSSINYNGYDVQFWRDEKEIIQLAIANQLNNNSQSVGQLLRGFFEYYAQTGVTSNGMSKGFDWGRDVISLRTQGGLITKQEKGWTGAKTIYEVQSASMIHEQQSTYHSQERVERNGKSKYAEPMKKDTEVKQVRLRYLLAIEDPFELDHNVARTVTHNGIVSIREEFRRAWGIVQTSGSGHIQDDILTDLNSEDRSPIALSKLITDIHSSEILQGPQT